MSILLSLFGNGVLGSLFGSLFSWLNKREEIKQQQAQFTHDENMLKAQNEQALALATKQIEGVKEAGEQAVAGKEADAFTASQVAANAPAAQLIVSTSIWLNIAQFIRVIVSVFKELMRPIITCYVLGLATYFGYNIGLIVQGLKAFDNAALFALYGQVIGEVFFLTNLAVSWWFGARGSSPRFSFSQAKQITQSATK
jgi:hypothetical protein